MREVRDTANVIFGSLKRDKLYICRTTSLYTMHLHTNREARITKAELEACKQS